MNKYGCLCMLMLMICCKLFAQNDTLLMNAYKYALHSGDQEQLWRVLNSGFNIEYLDVDGRTAIFYVSVSNDEVLLDELLRRGAHPNRQDHYGNTAWDYVADKESPIARKLQKAMKKKKRLKPQRSMQMPPGMLRGFLEAVPVAGAGDTHPLLVLMGLEAAERKQQSKRELRLFDQRISEELKALDLRYRKMVKEMLQKIAEYPELNKKWDVETPYPHEPSNKMAARVYEEFRNKNTKQLKSLQRQLEKIPHTQIGSGYLMGLQANAMLLVESMKERADLNAQQKGVLNQICGIASEVIDVGLIQKNNPKKVLRTMLEKTHAIKACFK